MTHRSFQLFPEGPNSVNASVTRGDLTVLIHERTLYGYIFDQTTGAFRFVVRLYVFLFLSIFNDPRLPMVMGNFSVWIPPKETLKSVQYWCSVSRNLYLFGPLFVLTTSIRTVFLNLSEKNLKYRWAINCVRTTTTAFAYNAFSHAYFAFYKFALQSALWWWHMLMRESISDSFNSETTVDLWNLDSVAYRILWLPVLSFM